MYPDRHQRGMETWKPNEALVQLTIGRRVTPAFETFSLFGSDASRIEKIKQSIIAKGHRLQSDFGVYYVEPDTDRYGVGNLLIKLFFGIELLYTYTAVMGNKYPPAKDIYDRVWHEIQNQEQLYQTRYSQFGGDSAGLASFMLTSFQDTIKTRSQTDELYELICLLYFYTHRARENKPALHCLALSMAGIISMKYYHRGQYLVFHDRAEHLLKSMHDTEVHMQVYYNAAVVYQDYASNVPTEYNYRKAQESYRQARSYAYKYDNHPLMFLSLLGMADTALYLREFDLARDCLDVCKEMIQIDSQVSNDEHRLFEMIQEYKINLRFEQMNYEKVKEYFDRVHSILFSIISSIIQKGVVALLSMYIGGGAVPRVIVYGATYINDSIFNAPTQIGSRNTMINR